MIGDKLAVNNGGLLARAADRHAIELANAAEGLGKSVVEVMDAVGKAFDSTAGAVQSFGTALAEVIELDTSRKWIFGTRRDHDARFTALNTCASKPYGQRRKRGK